MSTIKILHYSLGLPPYRTGGLTKYSIDLMISQKKMNHEIYLLYPGQMNLFGNEKIKENRQYEGIKVFELINPLPIPLRGGVSDPLAFMKPIDNTKLFVDFLNKIRPDVIHVHTLMGIYREFFNAVKKLGIKVVFTTHDYFGICPTVNLFKYNSRSCLDYDDGLGCAICNANAYSLPLIRIMQSHLYKKIKNNSAIKKIRSSRNNKQQLEKPKEEHEGYNINLLKKSAPDYKKLRSYYGGILSEVDLVLYNSITTKKEYEKYYSLRGLVLPITNSAMKDNRKIKNYDGNSKLNIAYFGPLEEYKGFFMMCEALKLLIGKDITSWKLHVYGNGSEILINGLEKHISYHGRYNYNQQEKIFDNTDVVIVPSVWKETFGLVAVESLSYGVPIIITNYVGAKDFISSGKNGMIVEPNASALSKALLDISSNRTLLSEMNRNICSEHFDFSLEEHAQQVVNTYKNIEKELK